MSKMFLETQDFDERLNKSMFINIEKSLNKKQFNETYPASSFDIFEKRIVENYITNIYEQTGGEIIKGGFNDIPEVSKVITHMKEQIGALNHVSIQDENSIRSVYVMSKSKEAENDKQGVLKKGIMSDDLRYAEASKIEFERTGKEIKDKIGSIKIIENEKIKEIESKLSIMQEKFTTQPTEELKHYNKIAKIINCPYKLFNWNLTYFEEGSSMNGSYECADGSYVNKIACKEDAAFHKEWNDFVEKWLNCKFELKAIELYENNLEDKKMYKLNAHEMLSLKF